MAPRSLESSRIKILPLKSPADLTRKKPPRSSAKAPGYQAPSLGLWQAEGNQELEGRAVCTSCSPGRAEAGGRRKRAGLGKIGRTVCMDTLYAEHIPLYCVSQSLCRLESEESFTSTFHVKFMSLCD